MISEIMWSPIPWVLAAIILSILSSRRLCDRPWAKWSRRIIVITAMTILVGGFVISYFGAKAKARRHQQQANTTGTDGKAMNQPEQATGRSAPGR